VNKPTDYTIMASLLDEAADILRRLPEDVAERLQVRHWLPDELDGSSLMLRDCAAEQAARADSTEPDMRHTLIVQLHNLIDLGERYAARMANIDPDEQRYAEGAVDHARKVIGWRCC